MNKPLILALSVFGLVMAVGTVFFISPSVEPLCWLAIFIICAAAIARRAPDRPFMHGLLVGVANSVWVTSAHVLFFDTYLAGHPREAQMMVGSALPGRAMMALTGPVIGVISGGVMGLLAMVARKFVNPASAPAA